MHDQPIAEDTKLTLTIGQLKRLLEEASGEIDITDYLRRSLKRIADITKRKDNGWRYITGQQVRDINYECEDILKIIEKLNVEKSNFKAVDAFKRIKAMTDRSVFDSWLSLPGEIVKEINEICEHTLSIIKG